MPARKPDPPSLRGVPASEPKPKRRSKKETPSPASLGETEAHVSTIIETSPTEPLGAELAGAADLFVERRAEIEAAIMEMVSGVKIALKVRKRHLERGEAEWQVETMEGETWWVYQQPPSVSLLKFAAEQVRGKAAAKEAKASASTLVLKLAVPGHDQEIDRYLATLEPETLARYAFDAATLERIAALRPR